MIYIDDSEPEGVLEPAFPYRDVTIKRGVDAYQLYDIIGEIGRGKFGTVYKCQEKSTGLKLAAKFVPIPKREDKRNVEREVEIMNSLQHHLITQLYAAYEYQKMMCVVLELIEGGELFDRVVDDEFILTERVCVVFVRQLCEAMEFIHRNNILHLDLKPENVLCLTQEGNRIKLIDFGLARKFDPNKRLQILFGTPEFVAPEVVNFDCISYGTDMWSVGVICYVLISGLSPFMGETDIETMANVTIAKYDFEDEAFSNVSSECLDFIGKLLVKDLSVRMTAAQCLKHKWLQPRPKAPPLLTQKSLNALAPKLTASTPSPIPPNSDDDDFPEVNEYDNVEAEAEVGLEDEDVAGGFHHKELDSTKGNLRNFIERWEEHPNSPYVFDVEGNVISPLSEATAKNYKDSLSSSRVCSPSPCESIATVADDDDDVFPKNTFNIHDDDLHSTSNLATPINESREKLFPPKAKSEAGASLRNSPSPSPTPTPAEFSTQYAPAHLFGGKNHPDFGAKLQQRSIKSYLHTFDRRNSDTNYLLGRRASGERVNLADEIRKLSDHLLMLAEINNRFGSDVKKDHSKTNVSSISSNDSNKNNTLQTKATTKSVSTNKSNKESTEITSTSSSTLNGGKPQRSTLSIQKLQQSIEETPKLANGGNFLPWAKPTRKSTISTIRTSNANSTKSISTKSIQNEPHTSSKTAAPPPPTTTKTTTTAAASESSNSAIKQSTGGSGENAAAKTRRAKFRVTQMSRDVPIGLPDMHHPVNLEEAATTTKDCLLHLLEKYNETKCRNTLARHQSISVDWNMRDNLEYRSMSSINAFFQRHNNTGDHIRKLRAQLHKKASGSFSK